MLVDGRRIGADRPVALVLAVEDAQRVALEPRDAVLGQVASVRLEIVDQRAAPGLARLGIAERVQLQRHAVGDAELAQQLVAEG